MAPPSQLVTEPDKDDRSRLEQELRQRDSQSISSGDRYRLISELISDYAYAFQIAPDGALTCEWVTDAFAHITGFTTQQVEANGGWASLIHPDDQPLAQQRHQKLLAGQQDVSEFRIIAKDGQVRWLRDHSRPIWDDAQGRVVGIVGAAQDITARQEAERALRASQQELAARERMITRIVESIPSSLLVIGHDLRVISANRNFMDKARRSSSETTGRHIEEVFPAVLLEYTRLDLKIREVFQTSQPLEGGKVSYRAPGISTRTYYYRLIPIKGLEGVENVMLLMDDITEREQLGVEVRRAERHLASIVECANDLVASLTPSGKIVTWNTAAERVSGHKAEEVSAQPLLALCAAQYHALMAETLRQLARGERVPNIEATLITANRQEVPIAWSFSSMCDDAGKVVGLVAVGRDLTERRQLEAQLIQSAKMASLGVLAGGIAHELRNPLGIISASAQLVRERPNDAELRDQCAEKIHLATQRASMIIENLLKFARPQGTSMRELDINVIIQDTLSLLANQLNLQKITLVTDLSPQLPKARGNADLLQQVFTNLILNACNAMPSGGTLTLSSRAGASGQVEIQVADTGQGIPPENTDKIFDPFFTTMPTGKGIGLGLSISYSIIQQHRGHIEVSSHSGMGTVFTIDLPGL